MKGRAMKTPAEPQKKKASTEMKSEYDFSAGVRGKFHKEPARIDLPIYLEEPVFTYLSKRAEARGTSVSDLVNQLLQKDIELIEAGS